MNAIDYDKLTVDLEKQMANLRPLMDRAVEQVVLRTVEFLHLWSKETVDRAIRDNDERIKSMDAQARASAKKEIEDLQKRISDIVNERLSGTGVWVHKSEIKCDESKTFSLYDVKEQFRGNFDEALRLIMGLFGAALKKHQLAGSYTHEWGTASGGSIRFGIGIPKTPSLEKAYAEYEALAEKYIALDHRLKHVRKDKAQAEARDLWEKS